MEGSCQLQFWIPLNPPFNEIFLILISLLSSGIWAQSCCSRCCGGRHPYLPFLVAVCSSFRQAGRHHLLMQFMKWHLMGSTQSGPSWFFFFFFGIKCWPSFFVVDLSMKQIVHSLIVLISVLQNANNGDIHFIDLEK